MITVLSVALLAAGPVAAGEPHGSSGQPENDTYIPVRTPEQAAFERVKLDIVATIPQSTVARQQSGDTVVRPTSLCVSDCGGGGGGGDDGGGDDGGSGTGGGTGGGTTGPATAAILDVRARRQAEAYWCGPASGQVVINYSRGYFYSNLGGENTTTNWKPQSTIAGWMKTNPSQGTLGGNLAAALNRPDAVLKPVPEWSYLYATNSDGADMHAKVVTDVWKYAMPLVIAVKPHPTGADYYLPSWPREAPGAKHWITIYGYAGFWDGTDDPQIYYTDSSGNSAQGPGQYRVGSLSMWKVNQYNAKTIVW